MLSKCANPNCPAPFHYLHEGKLYSFRRDRSGPTASASGQTELYWLCARCAQTLVLRSSGEMVLLEERRTMGNADRDAA